MSRIFQELIEQSRRITREEYALNFGGIANDVIEMLNSDEANRVLREAREIMENAQPLPGGTPRLQEIDFGNLENGLELIRGEVAAIDGTTTLPMQIYSAGQALCVGIGSLSHTRPIQDTLHYWSSRFSLSQAQDSDDFIRREERGLYGISQTAYLRYFEISHGLELSEPCLLFDGTIVYEWLVSSRTGVEKYIELFNSGKQCLGVMKNVKANPEFAKFARALRTGELFIIENLAYHLSNSNAPNRNQGESVNRYVLPEFTDGIAPNIWRGVFKPRNKAFGFEVHIDHLPSMIRIMAADCQMNHAGHEIPYLLNRIDEEVKKNFSQRILKDRISYTLATQGEGLFFEETGERDFR